MRAPKGPDSCTAADLDIPVHLEERVACAALEDLRWRAAAEAVDDGVSSSQRATGRIFNCRQQKRWNLGGRSQPNRTRLRWGSANRQRERGAWVAVV